VHFKSCDTRTRQLCFLFEVDFFPSSLIVLCGSTSTSSSDRRILGALSPSGEFSNVGGEGDGDVCDGNLQAWHLLTFDNFVVVLLNTNGQSNRSDMKQVSYRQDTPMELLLQVGSDFGRLECADLVFSETITECTSQWNRSSDELVLLSCITATLTAGEV